MAEPRSNGTRVEGFDSGTGDQHRTATVSRIPAPPPPPVPLPAPMPMSISDVHTPGDSLPISMPELDHVLSADFDQMLEGNFETIDAVLEGVFEEQAVLVQDAAGPAAPPALRQAPITVAVPAAAIIENVEIPQASTIEVPPPAPLAPPVIETSIPPAPAPPLQETAPVETLIETSPIEESIPAIKISVSSGPSLLVRCLMFLNAPLQMLPMRLRPLINIIAISLLVWVPIVWTLAFLTHQNRPPAVGPLIDEPTNALHAESEAVATPDSADKIAHPQPVAHPAKSAATESH